MNYQLRIVCFLLLLSSSCINLKKNSPAVSESILKKTIEADFFITDCDSIKRSNSIGYEQIRNQVNTFSDYSLVHCSPLENSEVIDTIIFNSAVRSELILTIDGIVWLEIFLNKNRRGYIKRNDVEKKILDYGNYLWASLGFNSQTNKNEIKIFEPKKENIIRATFSFDSIFDYEDLQRLKYLKLGNSDYVYSYKTYTKTIPKKTFKQFILVDTDNKTIVPITTSYTNDGNQYYSDVISENYYFPTVFPNGDTLHVKNGDVNNIFDIQNASLKVFTIPDFINKFKNDIIVRKAFHSFHKLDEDGEPMYDDEGDEIWISEMKIEYFRWSNNKLIRLNN